MASAQWVSIFMLSSLCRMRPAGFLCIGDKESYRNGEMFFKMVAEKAHLLFMLKISPFLPALCFERSVICVEVKLFIACLRF